MEQSNGEFVELTYNEKCANTTVNNKSVRLNLQIPKDGLGYSFEFLNNINN